MENDGFAMTFIRVLICMSIFAGQSLIWIDICIWQNMDTMCGIELKCLLPKEELKNRRQEVLIE